MNGISSVVNVAHPQSSLTTTLNNSELYRFFSIISDLSVIQSLCLKKKIVTWLKDKYNEIETHSKDESFVHKYLFVGLQLNESASQKKIEKRQKIALVYARVLSQYNPKSDGELDHSFNYFELASVLKEVFNNHIHKNNPLFFTGIKINCLNQTFYAKVERDKVCIFSNEVKEISKGDYGVVYRIYEISSRQFYALKLSKPAVENTSKAISSARKCMRYLSYEIMNLNQLHQLAKMLPNLSVEGVQAAPLFTLNLPSFCGFVGELYGDNLSVWTRGVHVNAERLAMCKLLMRAFENLIRLNYWHGDLKDRNVLVQECGCVIIDLAGVVSFQEAFDRRIIPRFYSYTHTNQDDYKFCEDYVLDKINDNEGESTLKEKFIALAYAWDLFSVSMILFQILSSVKPFKELNKNPWPITKDGICKDSMNMLKEKGYSQEVLQALTKMLNHNYTERLSVEEAIQLWEKIT